MDARPDVEADVGAVGFELAGQRLGCREKGILVADVEPDRRVVERCAARQRQQVVAGEVGGVVEREQGVIRATGVDGRRMASDRAEALRCESAEVERAETAHRDPADRDAIGVRAAAFEAGRNHLVEDVRAPRRLVRDRATSR